MDKPANGGDDLPHDNGVRKVEKTFHKGCEGREEYAMHSMEDKKCRLPTSAGR
jgi:hypothetical protein